MPVVFSQLQPASFAGVKFPVRQISITGGLRHYMHKYPHVPAGDPEKFGREPYEFKVSATFQVTFRKYPGLWPGGLQKLRYHYETGLSDDLVIPTLGKVRAYCTQWMQVSTERQLSGEDAEFSFIEDAGGDFLQTTGDPYPTIEALDANFKEFAKEVSKTDGKVSLAKFLDQIQGAVNSVIAVKDTIESTEHRLAASIKRVAVLCERIDSAVRYFDHPRHHKAKEALHKLWYSSQRLSRTLHERAEPRFYVTRHVMPITTIAASEFGQSSRAIDILRLNSIADPFAIPAGTRLVLPAK